MASAALRLARAVLEDPDSARQMATRLLSADRQRQARVRVKSAPRRARIRYDASAMRAASDSVRAMVMSRSEGSCELCGSTPLGALEWHHLAPGPLRKRMESTTTTCAICMECHRAWHRGDVVTLQASYEVAQRIGAPDVVLASLNRRIEKVTK